MENLSLDTNNKNMEPIQKLDQASVTRGKFIYTNHCLSCHGEKGLGDGPAASTQTHIPANLQQMTDKVPNFKFFISISQWKGDMPGWEGPFNESEREDLVSYIKTFRLH